jgi:Carboxypeptidase regulatory-like domain/TonB-dependent Receptor Plug Domain
MLNCLKATRAANRLCFAALSAFLCAVVLLMSGPVSRAQIYNGSINGAVTDSTGAAVAGAAITAKNIGSGETFSAVSSDGGNYTFTQLPLGAYEVRVSAKGFKDFVATGVEVHTSTVTELNAQLAIGAASETVTVEASDVQVQTTSAAAGEVVEGQQVRELPLNGENFMGLVTLSPGVSTAKDFNGVGKGLSGGSDFTVNGNPYTNNLFLVDGVNNNDVGSNRTILVYPSTDAIAEFKMLRNSYGPEYGQASGAIISITTRSGENQFHGGFFYAGRNDALDANNWFSNANQTGKTEERRNDWGYHISGPVIKNKLFFFWNQEWNREISGQSVSACVPTAAEKAGDFSGYTGTTDQCGATLPTIPLALQAPGNPNKLAAIDPAGSLLAQFYPDPNRPLSGGNNWASAENIKTNWSEWNIRGDYDLTKRNRITFRWTNDSWTSPAPNPNLFWGDTFFPTLQSDWSQPSKSVMAKLTTQIGSSMVNDVEFGYGHNAIVTTLTPSSLTYVQAVNAAIPTAWPSSLKLPDSYINGGGAWGGFSPYGSGQTMWTIAPYANHEDLYALQDNVSKVAGNHVFKFGAYWSTNAKDEFNNGGADQPAFPVGNPFTCPAPVAPGCVSGVQTNNSLANDLVPGNVFVSSENSVNGLAQVIWHDFEWYVGDTWKIRRNVTLSYGFRYSFYREPYSQNNTWASFSLAAWSPTEAAANPSDACNGVIVVPGTNPCGAAAAQLASLGISLPLSSGTPGPNRALVNNNNHDIAPRIGIAWDIFGDGRTALRAGVGQFFQRELVGIDETLARTAPFVINATDDRTLGTATPLSSPSVSPNASKDPSAVTPNSWQWNVSIERELARNTTLSVGYVGNAGIHMTSMADLNQLQQANWLQGAFLSGSDLNALRPADNFGTIGLFARGGHASYHSVQTLFRSRLGNYSTFQVAYTYSHSLGDVDLDNSSGSLNSQGFIDPADTNLSKGNTNINRPHIFVANEVFYLPKLTNQNTLVRGVLGGWEANSIISVSSGSSLSVYSNGASGNSLSYTCPAGSTWAACTGMPVGTAITVSSPLTSLTGTGFNQSNRPNVGSVGCNSGENGNQILNPDAFSFVGYQLGTVGTAGRGICYGPAFRNIDFQIAKNWYFKEHYRIKFSMDFFNLFNHPNFTGNDLEGVGYSANGLHCNDAVGPCGLTVNPMTGVTPNLANNVVSSQNAGELGTFGKTFIVQPAREIQYTLRFYF